MKNTLNLTLTTLLWVFEVCSPTVVVNSKKTNASMNLFNDAFEKTAFRSLKPFMIRFLLRSEQHAAIIRKRWEQIKKDDYVLRDITVNVNDVNRCSQELSIWCYHNNVYIFLGRLMLKVTRFSETLIYTIISIQQLCQLKVYLYSINTATKKKANTISAAQWKGTTLPWILNAT